MSLSLRSRPIDDTKDFPFLLRSIELGQSKQTDFKFDRNEFIETPMGLICGVSACARWRNDGQRKRKGRQNQPVCASVRFSRTTVG